MYWKVKLIDGTVYVEKIILKKVVSFKFEASRKYFLEVDWNRKLLEGLDSEPLIW